MDRNDYVRPQRLIKALPGEPTEEDVRKGITTLVASRGAIGFTYHIDLAMREIYVMGYRQAMKDWSDAIDKVYPDLTEDGLDDLITHYASPFDTPSVELIVTKRQVEELQATNAALSASFCEEKEALEAKIKELEKRVDEANTTIFDLREELDCMTRIRRKTEAQTNRDRLNRDMTIDVLLGTAVRPLATGDWRSYRRAWMLTDERGDVHRCFDYDGIGGVKPMILGTIARGGAIVNIERRDPE